MTPRFLKPNRIALLTPAFLLIALTAGKNGPDTGHPALSTYKLRAQALLELANVPGELVSRPITLRTGWGNLHDPVSTKSTQAQAFYDQGLGLLHLFEYLDAARSFHQALRYDSKLAMAYWGLSHAYRGLNEFAEAKVALDTALELAPMATPREQRRIHLGGGYMRGGASTSEDAHCDPTRGAPVSTGLSADNETPPFNSDGISIDSALVLDPGDPELWILAGMYDSALVRNPNHIGAHHYLIHEYEGAGRIDMALKHGAALAQLAPKVSHARHMYAHDLRRVGRLEEAIAQFEAADSLERAIYQADSIPSYYDWHHAHNLHLLAMAYQHQGRMHEAEIRLRSQGELVGGVMSPLYNKSSLLDFLLERGRLDEVMAVADSLITRGVLRRRGYLYKGHVLLARGDIKGAEQAMADAQASPPGNESLRSTMLLTGDSYLQAKLLLANGKITQGDSILREEISDWRRYLGPDGWINALFRIEDVATTARSFGAWPLAEYSAKQMLEHDSLYAGAHYAMGLVEQHKGNTKAATQYFATARRLWARADADLPELHALKR